MIGENVTYRSTIKTKLGPSTTVVVIPSDFPGKLEIYKIVQRTEVGNSMSEENTLEYLEAQMAKHRRRGHLGTAAKFGRLLIITMTCKIYKKYCI